MSLQDDWDSAKPLDAEWEKAKPIASQKQQPEVKDEQGRQLSYPAEPAVEAMLSMGTGMVAGPIADVAGIAAAGSSLIQNLPRTLQGKPALGSGSEPLEFKEGVRSALTYDPKTQQGKQLMKAFGTIGEFWDSLAGVAGHLVGGQDPGPLQAALGYAAKGAVQEAPMLVGGQAPEAAASVSKTLRTGAERSMQKALRPTLAEVQKGQDVTAINTMLEQKLNVTRGGLTKIQDRVGDLNTKIADIIKNSPAKIDRNKAAAYSQDTTNAFLNQVDSLNDVAAIEKVYTNFVNSWPAQIPIPQAQAIKSGTYAQLKNKSYGELRSAEIEAQKAIARGIKDKIAEAVPNVRPLNAEESKLLTALPMVERRVLQDANRHLVGFGWLTTNPAHLAAWMADRSPLFWSLVGRMMDRVSKVPSGRSGPVVGSAMSTESRAADDRRRLRMERARLLQQENGNAAQER